MNNSSVVICTYNDNIEIFLECLNSVLSQNNVKFEILVIDMSTNDEIKKICRKNGKIRYFYFKESAGLSDSRNFGVSKSIYPLVSFIDADAIADQQWLVNTLDCFRKNDATIVGGKIIPRWNKNTSFFYRNLNVMKSFFSLLDLDNKVIKTKRIFGANFSINKKLVSSPIFTSRLGRKKKAQIGGEETELCNEVISRGGKVFYTPYSVVTHVIPKNRTTIKKVYKKAYYDGFSRGLRKNRPSPLNLKFNIYDYLFSLFILPPYAIGFLKGILS